ncbi:MAG: discoidin domain-containing protein [Candidatus Eisenbacteria bacterium]
MKANAAVFLLLLCIAPAFPYDSIVLDNFEDLSVWSAHPADGVEARVSSDDGETGKALRVDFDFLSGGGYAVIRREIAIDLPENYAITFRIRAEAPENHLEFKLIDKSGENVWWSVKRDFDFPVEWQTVRIKKRQVTFAWGPLGGGELTRAEAIEFAVTAGSGGSGRVWIDDLEIMPLPPPNPNPPAPVASASAEAPGHGAALALDGDPATFWESGPDDVAPWIVLDLGGAREFGGLVIDWEPDRHAPDYDVEVSDDGVEWRAVREVRRSNGGRDYIYAPETESSWIRIRSLQKESAVGIREIAIQPLEWSATRNAFFEAIAKDAPRGTYPRGMSGEAVYWTVVGAPGDPINALFSEDGAIEPWPGEFSIEPFLYVDGELLTWNDLYLGQSLELVKYAGTSGRFKYALLPIHSVVSLPHITPKIAVTAFPIGDPGSSSLVIRYRWENSSPRRVTGTLLLAVRPFQVNPPYQFLNVRGGTAPVRSIEITGSLTTVNGNRRIYASPSPESFGVAPFEGGEAVEGFLRSGRVPEATSVDDPFEAAFGVLAFPFDLEKWDDRGGLEEEEVVLVIPLHESSSVPESMSLEECRAWAESKLEETRAFWEKTLTRREIPVPEWLQDEVHAQLSYILVNRSGPAIRPGTRAYARSWIRDGALTCTALLRLGHPEPVKEFIEWFAGYQYENGKIPCCVDDRGADPVPEHDSSGEFIYLVAEYVRYTKDLDLARAMWPRVDAAAEYLDRLRQERRTDEYRTPEEERFFGLLPPSISHEGYSAKPMHSYWDDFFALRGFKDAVYLAEVLGLESEKAHWTAVRDEFADELRISIVKTMEFHGIDYVPGCADLGDFDPTSTTIALDPVQAGDVVPREALERTFEKYWEFFVERRETGEWEAFTPYEMRNIGAFARLGWRDRAEELLAWFLEYRRPKGWNQWAEVVWKDERAPKFIGDMPHTWVGSDFIRSVLDLYPELLQPADSTTAR